MESSSSDDLPLMANTNDLLVDHYIFELACDFRNNVFDGRVVIHIKPRQTICSILKECDQSDVIENNNKEFVCILDCCDIQVKSVSAILIEESEFQDIKFNMSRKDFKEVETLKFSVDKWSLRIWKPGVTDISGFPCYLMITYATKPCGFSLMWVKDQDKKPAVYTYGAWINNRSLFPCQEPPVAMATWEASISVPSPAIVLMSGDNLPVLFENKSVSTYYYYTKMKLPLSTLALAVGYWKVENLFECRELNLNIDVRICSAETLLPLAVAEFSSYIWKCIKSAEELFGRYPFPRIDFLIVPRGFSSLGMASPNIIFLSQSVLSGDGSMCNRIAHEIAHAWFGLLIGASDWTEEWLSEGFATFSEDVIHIKTLQLQADEEKEYKNLRAYLRYRTLLAEQENTQQEDLLVLRPNKGEAVLQTVDEVEAIVLKNGQNVEKGFMQVHYIKGFFLLKHLCDRVGLSSFLEFLRKYIQKFEGQLVDSLEMLQLFVSMFHFDEKEIIDTISAEWLHSSGIPLVVSSIGTPLSNSIYVIASKEADKWKKLGKKSLKRRNPKRRKINMDDFVKMNTDSLLLLLDILLEEDDLSTTVMKLMCKMYSLEEKNAEIRHKWCELVVKHRYYAGYNCLEKFLKNDLAMGVYLYGELILNGTKAQKEFANKCFLETKDEMEFNSIEMIRRLFDASEKEI